jgi:hypothetical protein
VERAPRAGVLRVLYPAVDRIRPDLEVVALAGTQREGAQDPGQFCALALAGYAPVRLRSRVRPGGPRSDPSEPGHATQVGQDVRVVEPDGHVETATPRTTAIVRTDHEATLGVHEPCESVPLEAAESLGSGDPPLDHRIATDCFAHGSIVAAAPDALSNRS